MSPTSWPDGPTASVVDERSWPANAYVGHAKALEELLGFLRGALDGGRLRGVAHRVVHGGAVFTGPVLVDESTLARLQSFVPLAPLHQPHNLGPIRLMRELQPGLPQVACFDTSFHRAIRRWPTVRVAREFHEAGVRRYGFHGLSYAFMARCCRRSSPMRPRGGTVILPLGNGASMCALPAVDAASPPRWA